MAKKKKESKAPEVIEKVEDQNGNSSDGVRAEEYEMAGSEVVGFLKKIWREGNVRRIIVQNEAGETILNIPVAVGALGFFPPFTATVVGVAAIGTVVAVLTKCKITVERNTTG